ncbi:sirohydrochlorin cobaltochelatase [Veillonella sp.]|uniref:sirohydrochlorin cobaltochelatase n=1 Tax=Veillonella sp. TaxID=1926307 RepID=UPI001DF4EF51|nr:sirohydrochlorin cobaltochelatase [Veillonella sp.]MBS6649224.1 sirohydrochlorin cobaltochelatase [Veillonella sp.]
MISVKKQALTVSAALAAFALTFGAPVLGHAAYQLNPEVKDATPALKEASAIGVRTHNTEALQNLPNKDAMVVMSFGTTYKDTRAFTSHIIRDRIQQKEGITYPTPEEALAELKKDGYTRVALASLDVIPGMEYNYDAAVYNLYKDNFKKMTLGTSLMYWMGQENQTDQVIETLKAVQSQFPKLGKEDGLLIMAHGTPDPSNAYYSVIQDRIHTLGMKNVFVYTVEGTPNLEQVIPQLKLHGIKHVTLMPFMMVAGDHANNDMAGNEPDSHKSILEKEGFKVDTYIHGLGENPNIRKLFVERANESWDALQK